MCVKSFIRVGNEGQFNFSCVHSRQNIGTFRRHERSIQVRIVVDLTRCQSYGQCVFLASTVFRFHGEEALEYDYTPDDQLREQVRWAAAACPVHAITLDYLDEQPETVSQPEWGHYI